MVVGSSDGGSCSEDLNKEMGNKFAIIKQSQLSLHFFAMVHVSSF